MSLRRVFLGWDRPGLAAAADWLVARFGQPGRLDLSGATVVALSACPEVACISISRPSGAGHAANGIGLTEV
jgi:hypothetical protein